LFFLVGLPAKEAPGPARKRIDKQRDIVEDWRRARTDSPAGARPPMERQQLADKGGNMDIRVLDIGIGILVLLFLVRGLLRGLIQEVAGLIGLFLGLLVAGRYYPQLQPQFLGLVDNPRWAAGLAYGLLFLAAVIVVALAAALVRKFLTLTLMAWLDNLLGGIVGAAKGVLVCAIGLALMQRFVPDSPFLTKSLLAPYIGNIIDLARSLLPAFLETGGM
jgi:membrane protein required for colicin V production